MEAQQVDKRAAWEADAAAMRAKLGTPGVAEREELKKRSGIEFLHAISACYRPARDTRPRN